MAPEFLTHLALVALGFFVAAVAAWKAHGSLEGKLAQAMTPPALYFGAFAISILAGRLYFSRPIFFGGAALSLLSGIISVCIKHHVTGLRVGVLASEGVIPRQWSERWTVIDTPSSNLARFDILLVTLASELSADWTRALSKAALSGAEIRYIAEYVEETKGHVLLDHFSVETLGGRELHLYNTFFKRLMDITIVLFFLPAALTIGLIGAALVWITSGRPVLFVQSRVGRGGRIFRMYKLRTMTRADPDLKERATAKSDQRIIPAGKWLRRLRIDELPQLWNVLRGDMSLIGPRPEQPLLADEYVTDLPEFAFRHILRPGITGWAQVNAGYAADLEETKIKLAYDLFYVKNISFSLDLAIIGRTAWTLVAGDGAR